MIYTLWLWCAYIEEASVDVLVASDIVKMIGLWFYDTDRLWFQRCCFVFKTITCFPMLLMMLTHNNNNIFRDHTRLKHDYIVIISSHTTCFKIMKDSGQLFFSPHYQNHGFLFQELTCETMLEAIFLEDFVLRGSDGHFADRLCHPEFFMHFEWVAAAWRPKSGEERGIKHHARQNENVNSAERVDT